MPAQNVTATAHFVGPLDHFKCYVTYELTNPYIGEAVYLEDQFTAINTTVLYPGAFCNPVEKHHDGKLTEISNDDHHLTCYSLDNPEGEWRTWYVEINNQFGTQNLTVKGPMGLAVPTHKVEPGDHEPPLGLDHFMLYLVEEIPPVEPVDVVLNDQFGGEPDALVYEPILFANPVRKTRGSDVTEIINPADHLVFYEIDGAALETQVQVVNQFGNQTLDLIFPEALAVPSEKVSFVEQIDHFKCYHTDAEPPGAGEPIYLKDQFHTVAFPASVDLATYFCNPVEKAHGDVLTRIWHEDHHLTIYSLLYEGDPQYWGVEVDNQFGLGQLLWISGPHFLAVPTQKEGHDPPVGLDHFLIYGVTSSPSVSADVDLHDQFQDQYGVSVFTAAYFAVPAEKTHGTEVTEIMNPEDHLVFYWIDGSFEGQVQVVNQFGTQELPITSPALLAVPSVKVSYVPD
jgi:hypothetical protein